MQAKFLFLAKSCRWLNLFAYFWVLIVDASKKSEKVKRLKMKKPNDISKDELAEVFKTERPRLLRYACYRMADSDDAEDVLQDCFVKVFSAAADYKSQGKPLAWILTITRNLCLQLLRDKKKQADIPEED